MAGQARFSRTVQACVAVDGTLTLFAVGSLPGYERCQNVTEYHRGELRVQLATKKIIAVTIGLQTAVIVALLLAIGGTVHADDGTPAQRRACRPDVFRLCGVFIPREVPITRCLERNMDRLSEACRAVFEGRLR